MRNAVIAAAALFAGGAAIAGPQLAVRRLMGARRKQRQGFPADCAAHRSPRAPRLRARKVNNPLEDLGSVHGSPQDFFQARAEVMSLEASLARQRAKGKEIEAEIERHVAAMERLLVKQAESDDTIATCESRLATAREAVSQVRRNERHARGDRKASQCVDIVVLNVRCGTGMSAGQEVGHAKPFPAPRCSWKSSCRRTSRRDASCSRASLRLRRAIWHCQRR